MLPNSTDSLIRQDKKCQVKLFGSNNDEDLGVYPLDDEPNKDEVIER